MLSVVVSTENKLPPGPQLSPSLFSSQTCVDAHLESRYRAIPRMKSQMSPAFAHCNWTTSAAALAQAHFFSFESLMPSAANHSSKLSNRNQEDTSLRHFDDVLLDPTTQRLRKRSNSSALQGAHSVQVFRDSVQFSPACNVSFGAPAEGRTDDSAKIASYIIRCNGRRQLADFFGYARSLGD